MKNKLNDNIKNAVEKITNIINNPIKNKKFAFLFGSGINKNIAQNTNLDWDNLSKKILLEFLDLKNEKLKFKWKWAKNALSKKINKEINDNKISCSFSKKPKLEINSKSKEENSWFKEGFDLIQKKFSYEIIVMTLNYDRVLSQNLKDRKARNFLLYDSIDPKKEILHLHGLVDEENFINEEETILTLKDYAKNSSIVEKKFFKFLFGKVKKNDNNLNNHFTLLIIGTSLKEQHLLNAMYKFREKYKKEKKDKKDKIANINIFLIVHNNWKDFIFEKYENIYQNINIEIININSGNKNTYEEDFKTFWKNLANKIKKDDFDFNQVNFGKKDDFSDKDLYKILKNKFKNQKNVSINQIINFAKPKFESKNLLKKPKFKLKNSLIRPIYWLEKNDEIVKNKTLKKYILMQDDSKQFNKIPINKIHWIENEKLLKKEKDLILEEIERSLENKNNSLDYEIEEFVSKIYKEDKKIDLEKYKYIHIFLIKEIAKNELEEKLEKYVLDKTYFSKNLTEDSILLELTFRFYKDYFKLGNPISKIIKNTLSKNKKWFKFKIPESLKDVFKITQKWKKFHKKPLLFYFFSIKKYNKIIFKDLDSSLNILIKNLNKKNKNDNRLFFVLLCSVFLNSNKENKFIEKLKESKEINDFFDSFPILDEYLNFFIASMAPFSKYDGISINKNLSELKFEKILEYSKKGINQEIISKFLNKELNDFSEIDRNIKWLIQLNKTKSSIFFFIEININTKDWKTYLEHLEKIEKEELNYLGKLYINPPYQASERLDYLIDEFEKKMIKKFSKKY